MCVFGLLLYVFDVCEVCVCGVVVECGVVWCCVHVLMLMVCVCM